VITTLKDWMNPGDHDIKRLDEPRWSRRENSSCFKIPAMLL